MVQTGPLLRRFGAVHHRFDSTGSPYASFVKVVNRYRAERGDAAEADGTTELRESSDKCGGSSTGSWRPAGLRGAAARPHAAAARKTITDCLSTLGIDVPIIEYVGRYPSPTVLVDGVDVMRLEAGAPIGDACRLDLPTPQRVLNLNASRANGPAQNEA